MRPFIAFFLVFAMFFGCASYRAVTTTPAEDFTLSGSEMRWYAESSWGVFIPFKLGCTYQAVEVETVEAAMCGDAVDTLVALERVVRFPACGVVDTEYGEVLACVIGEYRGAKVDAIFDPEHNWKDFQSVYVLGIEKAEILASTHLAE